MYGFISEENAVRIKKYVISAGPGVDFQSLLTVPDKDAFDQIAFLSRLLLCFGRHLKLVPLLDAATCNIEVIEADARDRALRRRTSMLQT